MPAPLLQPAPAAPGTETPLLGGRYCSTVGTPAVATGERGRAAIASVRALLESGEYALERIPCLCGSDQERCIATVDRYHIPHRTVMCTRCALLRTNPRMTAAAYAHFYANHYRAIYERPGHDPARYFQEQSARGQARARFVMHDILPPGAGARVAEIGCGAGWNLMPYRALGWEAVGWDVDDAYLALGAKRGLDLRHGLLPDACASGERFHLVILSHVLEHFLDPIADLRALRGMLLPRGALFVEVPSLFAASQLARYFQNAHTWSFVPQTLETTMRAAGFRRVAMNGMIESLWQVDAGGAAGEGAGAGAGAKARAGAEAHARAGTPIPADPALVQRTLAFLRRRERGSALTVRIAAMQHRAWRLRDALRRHARISLSEA